MLATLGRHAAESGKFPEAAQWYEQLGARMGQDGTAYEGWMAAGRIRMVLNDLPGAQKDFQSAANVGGNRRGEALAMLAQAKLKARDMAGAKAAATQTLAVDKTNPQAAAVLAEVAVAQGERPDVLAKALAPVVNAPSSQGEDTAKALWYLGELLYRNFKAIPADQIDQKVAALQQLQGIYNQAASMGSSEWAVASLWKLGLSMQSLAESVEATPTPAGLSAADAQQFKSAVKQQVLPIKEQADEAFKTCLARANQLEVYSQAVIGCRARSETARSPLPAPPAPGNLPTGFPELQKKAESTQDAAALEALGLAYLEAKQIPMAQLSLARATELGEARSKAQNGLGVALLYQGEPMAARAAYAKAIEADPANEKARANLAALRCRYGDQDGARKELSGVKGGTLGGFDVDPEWRACR